VNVAVMGGVKPKNVAKVDRKTYKKDKNATSKAKQVVGKKPHHIQIKVGGDINGRSDGKNAWNEVVRTLIPWILNVNVIDWEHHEPTSLEKLRATINRQFEYVDNELYVVGFRNVVKRWLKYRTES
jgi:hypothetical protein